MIIRNAFILQFCIFLGSNCLGQELKDFSDIINIDDEFQVLKRNVEEIKSLDISHFWTAAGNPQRPFGFIGTNYRRLHIALLSVIKNDNQPDKYFVYGKSRVANNICPFQGILTIRESYYIESAERPAGDTGILAGTYTFYESRDSNHAGTFEGRVVTYWYKDKDGLKYNDLWSVAAGYNNNQFAGTWIGYQNNNKLTANWGDGRVPNSGDLDVGSSEFGVNEKYASHGWASFLNAWGGGNNEEERRKAIAEETEIWWKD